MTQMNYCPDDSTQMSSVCRPNEHAIDDRNRAEGLHLASFSRITPCHLPITIVFKESYTPVSCLGKKLPPPKFCLALEILEILQVVGIVLQTAGSIISRHRFLPTKTTRQLWPRYGSAQRQHSVLAENSPHAASRPHPDLFVLHSIHVDSNG